MRCLDGGNDAVVVVGMQNGKYLGCILSNFLRTDPINVADCLTGERKAKTAIGAYLKLKYDAGHPTGNFPETIQSFLPRSLRCFAFGDIASNRKQCSDTTV